MSIFVSLLFFLTPVDDSSLVFQKIEYASFDVNSYRTKVKDSMYIHLYCSFSTDGTISTFSPGDLSFPPVQYYSAKLSKDHLQKINNMLIEKKKLRGHLISTAMDENSYYAGSYGFYRVTYKNGTKDSICIIQPFASKSLRDVSDILTDLLYRDKKRTPVSPFSIPSEFLQSIRKAYSKSTYLPPIKEVPSFRN